MGTGHGQSLRGDDPALRRVRRARRRAAGRRGRSYGELGLRFDRARSLLWLGRAARRARKRTAARRALETAGAEFDALGSPGWAGQARDELDLLGAKGAASAGGRRRPSSGWSTWRRAGCRTSRSPGACSWRSTRWRFTSPTPTPSSASIPGQLASRLASPPRRKTRIEGFRYRAGRPVVGSLLRYDRTEDAPARASQTSCPGAHHPVAAGGHGGQRRTGRGIGRSPTAACSALSGPSAWGGPPAAQSRHRGQRFNGVTVLSPCDAWAVGFDQNVGGLYQTLIEHWDGTAWTVAPSPNVAGLNNQLYAVRADSATDIWAVGESFATGTDQPLILHWDGHTWAQVASPHPGGKAYLEAVRAVSPTTPGRWAPTATPRSDQLILHWNGHEWAQVARPHPGTNSALYGVAATSASNAWAVGTFFNGTALQGFILHWNGQKWARQASPNPGGAARDTRLERNRGRRRQREGLGGRQLFRRHDRQDTDPGLDRKQMGPAGQPHSRGQLSSKARPPPARAIPGRWVPTRPTTCGSP